MNLISIAVLGGRGTCGPGRDIPPGDDSDRSDGFDLALSMAMSGNAHPPANVIHTGSLADLTRALLDTQPITEPVALPISRAEPIEGQAVTEPIDVPAAPMANANHDVPRVAPLPIASVEPIAAAIAKAVTRAIVSLGTEPVVAPVASVDPTPAATSPVIAAEPIAPITNGVASHAPMRGPAKNVDSVSGRSERQRKVAMRATPAAHSTHEEMDQPAAETESKAAAENESRTIEMARLAGDGTLGSRGEPKLAGEVAKAAAPRAATDIDTPTLPRSGDRVTLPFEGENGLEGRLHVALRGNTLQATIVTPDRESALRMESTIAELHRALADKGFGDVRVAIQAGSAESADARTRKDEGDERRSRHEPHSDADDSRSRRQRQRNPER